MRLPVVGGRGTGRQKNVALLLRYRLAQPSETVIMGELKIREMEQDGDFAGWFSELVAETEEAAGWGNPINDRYLVLSNEIGDWIGGLRFSLRGGVAHLLDVAGIPHERHQGHPHRPRGGL